MKTQRGGPTAAALRGRLRNITLWLLGPSAALVPIALVYLRADGLPHVFVHTLAGWNTGLLLLLAAAHRGRPPSRRDGLLPLALALYALAPDLMYSVGPAHRDWMDVFLFHVALDEILPYALPVLSALWAVQWVALLAVSRRPGAPAGAPAVARGAPPPRTGSRQFAFLLLGVAAALAATVAAGLVAERTASTPLVRVGQPAPAFALDSSTGSTIALVNFRGRSVLLVFVPSVRCAFCRAQLRAVQQALPDLRARGVAVLAVSTDPLPVQQRAAGELGLEYPLLSEAPIAGRHPVGSAYGVYHLPQRHPGPVNANAVVVVDSAGTVRAVRVESGTPLAAAELLALATAGETPAR